jgi:hypothetical protein
MFTSFFNSPFLVAISIAAIACLNYALAAVALKYESRQQLLNRAGAASGAPSGQQREAAELVRPFGMAIVVIALSFFVDSVTREAIAGGYLVMQLATLSMNLEGVLRMRALLRPGMAEGHILFSREYQYRSLAARLIAMALFSGVVALMFWHVAFAVGTAFLLATAAGWDRRARQLRRGDE